MIQYRLVKEDGNEHIWGEELGLNHWEPSFGKQAGWYALNDLTSIELATEIERKEIDDFGNSLTVPQVRIPNQYTVLVEDLSLELAEKEAKAKSKKAIELGSEILAHVRYLNVKKNMNASQFQAMLADQNLALIERLLWLGSFETAKAAVAAYSGSHFSVEEKADITALIDLAIIQVG